MDNTVNFKNPDERKAFKVGDPELFSMGAHFSFQKTFKWGLWKITILLALNCCLQCLNSSEKLIYLSHGPPCADRLWYKEEMSRWKNRREDWSWWQTFVWVLELFGLNFVIIVLIYSKNYQTLMLTTEYE